MVALPGRRCRNPSPSFPTGLLPGSHSACEGCSSGGASPGCSQRLRCVPAPSWASPRDTPSLQHNHGHVLKQLVPTATHSPATEVHSHVPLPSFQVFLFVLVKSLKFLRCDTPIPSFSFWGKASTLLLFPSNCREPSLEEIWAEAGHLLTHLFMETNTRVAPLSALSMAQGSSHETQNSHTTCQYSPAIIFFFFTKK